MGVLDRAGNLLKGFLRKPLEALEKSPAERQLERELEEKAALERARANIDRASEASEERERAGRPKADQARIDAMEREAGPVKKPAVSAKPDAKPEPDPANKDDGRTKKRRMGPD